MIVDWAELWMHMACYVFGYSAYATIMLINRYTNELIYLKYELYIQNTFPLLLAASKVYEIFAMHYPVIDAHMLYNWPEATRCVFTALDADWQFCDKLYIINWNNSLKWRHNERDGVSDHQPNDCLLNRLFGRRSKKTSKHRVTGLCAGNSPVTDEFPAQRATNAENVSI